MKREKEREKRADNASRESGQTSAAGEVERAEAPGERASTTSQDLPGLPDGPRCVDRVCQAESSSTTWCPLFMGWWGALQVAVVGGGISRGLHSPPFSYPHHVLRLPLTFT